MRATARPAGLILPSDTEQIYFIDIIYIYIYVYIYIYTYIYIYIYIHIYTNTHTDIHTLAYFFQPG